MINTLIDLFLLISTDKKSITSNNLCTFYQFIAKKLIDIENQRPNIISSFLSQNNSKNEHNDKINHKQIDGFIYHNKDIIKKITKDVIIYNFQNELLSLFNDMIDYLYEENLVILSDEQKHILKNIINKKLSEKNILYSSNAPINNLLVQKIKKKEIRKYILELINNNNYNSNFLLFDFSIKNYINFFNTKNIEKNRCTAEKFVNLINAIIKIYNTDKKNIYNKKINTVKIKSLGKIPFINIDNTNNIIIKEKSLRNKNTKNDINKYYNKVNHSVNNGKREYFNLNNIFIKKKKRQTAYNNIQKEPKNINIEDKNNKTQDTIPGQTLNNCYSLDNLPKNENIGNYLNNIIKNVNTNTNRKRNELNLRKINYNKMKDFYSKSQRGKNNTKDIDIKHKPTLSAIFNKDINDLNKKSKKYNININNCNLLGNFTFDNDDKNNNNNIDFIYVNKNENDFNEKNIGCIIY